MTTRSASPCTVLTDGCHLVVDALKANDVDTIYGVVGIPITDLARAAQASGIRYIGFRHEASAGNAAAAAGFLTARPGVCLTTSGPGFLNGLPALANATTNCFPMIQISGSSSRPMVDLQRGDYQDLDQLNAARPFVKAAYRIGQVQDIGRGVARAIRTATSGRPGGVYLDIPGDVLGQAVEASAASGAIWRPVDPAPRLLPAPEAIDRALDVLAQAQRPLLVLSKGAAYAQADNVIREFVEHTGIPFLPMSMAKGLLPDSHPQSAAAARSLAMARADVVLLVGARLNWLLGNGESPQWSADAKFIQVDIEASEFDSNRPIVAPLTGDIGSVMSAREFTNSHPANISEYMIICSFISLGIGCLTMGHGVEGRNRPSAPLDSQAAAQVASTLQALATPSRLMILTQLRNGPLPVTDLAEAIGMEQSAVSHQLRVLRNLGLVVGDRAGRSIVYSLYDTHVAQLLDEAIYHSEHLHLGLSDRHPSAG